MPAAAHSVPEDFAKTLEETLSQANENMVRYHEFVNHKREHQAYHLLQEQSEILTETLHLLTHLQHFNEQTIECNQFCNEQQHAVIETTKLQIEYRAHLLEYIKHHLHMFNHEMLENLMKNKEREDEKQKLENEAMHAALHHANLHSHLHHIFHFISHLAHLYQHSCEEIERLKDAKLINISTFEKYQHELKEASNRVKELQEAEKALQHEDQYGVLDLVFHARSWKHILDFGYHFHPLHQETHDDHVENEENFHHPTFSHTIVSGSEE